MPNIGPLEISVVLIIALIVFGPEAVAGAWASRWARGSASSAAPMTGEDKDEDDDDTEMRELQQSKARAEAETIESVEGEVVADKRS